MSKNDFTRIVIIASSLFFAPAMSFGFGGKAHVADFKSVFNGYDDKAFDEFYTQFTLKLDDDKASCPNSLCQTVRRALAQRYTNETIRILDNHRSIGHQWIVGGSIPSDSIYRFERKYPGCKEVLEPVWSKFCDEQYQLSSRLLGIPTSLRGINESYVKLVHCIHLLGDRMPGNTRVDLVLPLSKIKGDILDASGRLFKSHKEFYPEIKKELNRVMGLPLDDAAKSKELMKALKLLQYGTKLHACFGNTIEKVGHKWIPPKQSQSH